MILNYKTFGKQNKGSSLNFSASGGRDKEKEEKATEKIAVQSEGEAEGRCGGNSASPEPKRSPAALLVQSRSQQKSFLFLLKEKNRRAQIKKCEENFFAEQRAKRAVAGRSVQISQSGFCSKKVRISSNKHHHIELVASLGASSIASASWRWESVSAIPAKAGRQNRNIFVSLIEKNFGGAQLKNCKENFSVLSAVRGRKRWAGINPQNPLNSAQNGFGFRPINTTKVIGIFSFKLINILKIQPHCLFNLR